MTKPYDPNGTKSCPHWYKPRRTIGFKHLHGKVVIAGVKYVCKDCEAKPRLRVVR